MAKPEDFSKYIMDAPFEWKPADLFRYCAMIVASFEEIHKFSYTKKFLPLEDGSTQLVVDIKTDAHTG